MNYYCVTKELYSVARRRDHIGGTDGYYQPLFFKRCFQRNDNPLRVLSKSKFKSNQATLTNPFEARIYNVQVSTHYLKERYV